MVTLVSLLYWVIFILALVARVTLDTMLAMSFIKRLFFLVALVTSLVAGVTLVLTVAFLVCGFFWVHCMPWFPWFPWFP